MARAPYEDTTVSIAKSKADIMEMLEREGVHGVQWTMLGPKTILRFQVSIADELYMVNVAVDPEAMGRPFKFSTRSKKSRAKQQEAHVAKESQRLHRTLWWYIKSKFEAIASGMETPTAAWLSAIEGPRGRTVSQEMAPKLPGLKQGTEGLLKALPSAVLR